MKRTLFAGLGAGAAVLALAIVGCSADAPTAVQPRVGKPVVMGAITRYEPLVNDVTVSATIGSEGGSFSIPETGLTVTVPAGAVPDSVVFSATAHRGKIVAYDFQPAGRFAVPIQVTQDLYYTSWHHQADLSDVFGGYYTGENALDDEQGEAEVSELPPSVVDVEKCKITLAVAHFSGYVIATGRNRRE